MKRGQFTTDQKVAILRRHLVDKVAVSALCEEYKLQPSVFYLRQKRVFDNLANALQPAAAPSSRPTDKDRKIEPLHAKLVPAAYGRAWRRFPRHPPLTVARQRHRAHWNR